MSLSLYEISAEYKQVLNDLESMEDIDSQVISDTLEPYKHDLEAKCLNVAAYIKNIQAEADSVREHENKLKARRVALENRAKSFKAYLAAHLPHKLSDGQTVISPRKGSEKVVITNLELLPEDFLKIEKKPVLTKVKEWLKDDPEIAEKYARIEIGDPTVTIK